MSMSRTLSFLQRCALLAVLWLAFAQSVIAAAYDFEIVVFERPDAIGEISLGNSPLPDPSMASATLGAGALPASARGLGPVVYTLKRKGMLVHEHLAWRQTPGARNSRSWRWLEAGRLSGLIRVTRGRYLHLDADLVFRDAATSVPHRIQVSRRFRSNELHYVDHPKLGILIQARRHATGGAKPADADAASGEPKPAKPLGAS
jgi:hypothetical protein